MNITYLIDGMYNSAGMERVVANKAKYLSAMGYNVTILTTNQKGRKFFYDVPQNVQKVDLDINFDDYVKSNIIVRIFSYLKKKKLFKSKLTSFLFNNQQDCLVCTMSRGSEFLFDINDGSKKIFECHFNRYSNYYLGKAAGRSIPQQIIYSIRDFFTRQRIKKYDKFVVLTKEDMKYWGSGYKNITSIPNSIAYGEEKSDLNSKIVLAVGRLDYQKGFDILLKIWSEVSPEFPDWNLHIYGNGQEKDYLLSLCKKLNINNTVTFFSATQNINEVFLKSSIFAFPSRFEGFGIVLWEAMNKGIPPVAFNCKCGPSEVITDGENGFLCDLGDCTSFKQKLRLLMTDSSLRRNMGNAANNSMKKYDHSVVMNQWNDLFADLCKK